MSGSSPSVGRGAFARSCRRCSRLFSLSRCRSCRFFSFWRFAGVVGMKVPPAGSSCVDEGPEVLRPSSMAQPFESLRFDLSNALTCHGEPLTHFLQRSFAVLAQTEAH